MTEMEWNTRCAIAARSFKIMAPFQLGIVIDALSNGLAISQSMTSVLISSSAPSPANGSLADLKQWLSKKVLNSSALLPSNFSRP